MGIYLFYLPTDLGLRAQRPNTRDPEDKLCEPNGPIRLTVSSLLETSYTPRQGTVIFGAPTCS